MRRNKLWDKFFGDAACVKNYHFYSYEYLDDLGFMPFASDLFDGWPHAKEVIDRVGEKFVALGCTPDKDFQAGMQIMWLPPFAGAAEENNYGCYVLHYKQLEDGISWLASPFVLPFYRLHDGDGWQCAKPGSRDRMEEGLEGEKPVAPWPGQLGLF